MEFYKEVFGGTLAINTYGDFGRPDTPDSDKIMHAMLETPSGFTLMGADVPPGTEHTPGNNFSVSLSGDDTAELRGYWEKLSATARCPCRWRSRCGATSSACARTGSASPGWSTSASDRADRAVGRVGCTRLWARSQPPLASSRAAKPARSARSMSATSSSTTAVPWSAIADASCGSQGASVSRPGPGPPGARAAAVR